MRSHVSARRQQEAHTGEWKFINLRMAPDLHAEVRQVDLMFASPKRSALLSGLLHAGAIALVLLATNSRSPFIGVPDITPARDLGRYISLVPHRAETGGGGGGVRDERPASKGVLPRVDRRPFVPPVVKLINFNPILPMEPAILGTPDSITPILGQIGDPNGVPGLLSGGPGSGGGIGDGHGKGIGNKTGDGAGPGDGGEGISGTSRIRGAVVQPELLFKIEPEYTDEARRAKLQGSVMLRIEVNERGQAQNISVRQGLGLGLDERAVEAVKRWKFRPGTIGGKPAVTIALVQVNFRLL